MGVATFQRARARREAGGNTPAAPLEIQKPVNSALVCPKCGRECKSLLGFNKHVEFCKGVTDGSSLLQHSSDT